MNQFVVKYERLYPAVYIWTSQNDIISISVISFFYEIDMFSNKIVQKFALNPLNKILIRSYTTRWRFLNRSEELPHVIFKLLVCIKFLHFYENTT